MRVHATLTESAARNPDHQELFRLIGAWLRYIILPRAWPRHVPIPDTEDLTLKKFGILPHTIVQRLEQASLEQIEAWSLNFVDATQLDDVFR